MLDLGSRRVIGWALELHLQASLATAALIKAIVARRPVPGSLIHHSDRGVQYACKDYTDLLKTHDIQPLRSDRKTRHRFEKVNSSHHQAIDRLGAGLEVESWCATDDVIEQVKLRDYPFALADLFLKRALGLLAIVGIAFAMIATFGFQSAAFAQFIHADPRQVSILVTLWVSTALLYPTLKRVTAWFVDKIVLRRPDYSSLRATIARKVQTSDDVPTVLSAVCALLEPTLSAPSVTWREWRPRDDVEVLGPVVSTGTEATALLKAASGSDDSSDLRWTINP